jgi:hypothetical protein
MPRKPKSNTFIRDGNGVSSLSAAQKPHRDDGDREFPPHLLRDRQQNDTSEEVAVEALVPNAVFVARDALSSEECRMWIDYAEGIGDGWDKVSHPATKWIAHRECGRIQRSDWDMSHCLFRRIERIVRRISPQLNIVDEAALLTNLVKARRGVEKSDGPPRKKYRPVTCNPNLRLYKYTKGQWFGRHVDESNKIDFPRNSGDLVDGPLSAVDAWDGLRTEITVLFYLSSCRGGATRFHLAHGRKSSVAFTPEEGAVLLHVHGDHCLEHEAEPVIEGVKYGKGQAFFFITFSCIPFLARTNHFCPLFPFL